MIEKPWPGEDVNVELLSLIGTVRGMECVEILSGTKRDQVTAKRRF